MLAGVLCVYIRMQIKLTIKSAVKIFASDIGLHTKYGIWLRLLCVVTYVSQNI